MEMIVNPAGKPEIHLKVENIGVLKKAQDSLPGTEISVFRQTGSKGTVYRRELADWPLEDLLEEVGEEVVKIHKFPLQNPTPGRFLVEFSGKCVPAELKLRCGLVLSVRPHTPMPLRCRKCLVYGHHERTCNRTTRCTNCSTEGHTAVDCIRDPFCRSCKAPHAPTSSSCESFQREKEALKIRATQGCSMNSARKKVPVKALPSAPASVSVPRSNRPVSPPATATQRDLFPPLPRPRQANNQPPPPANNNTAPANPPQSEINQQVLALMTQQMAILTALLEQNKSIMEQNQKILTLLMDRSKEADSPKELPKRRRLTQPTLPFTSATPSPTLSKPELLVVSLGKDPHSPLSPNMATFDYKVIETKNTK